MTMNEKKNGKNIASFDSKILGLQSQNVMYVLSKLSIFFSIFFSSLNYDHGHNLKHEKKIEKNI